MITTVEGNYDDTTAHDLSKIVWPLVKARMSEKRHQVLEQIKEAISHKRLAAGIEEVW